MAQTNKAGKFALGALIAGVAGYVTGILTAPKSGKDTRKDIENKAVEFKSEAEAQLHKAQAELKEAVANVQGKGAKLTGKAKTEFSAATKKAKIAQVKSAQVLKAARSGKAKDPTLNAAIKQAKEARKNLGKFLKA